MDSATLRQTIEQSSKIRKWMEDIWDFLLVDDLTRYSWAKLKCGRSLELVGRAGSGAVIVLCEPEPDGRRPVLYVGSEGESGRIGCSLDETMQMMISVPQWKDCLHFSGDGQLEQMHRAQHALEGELQQRWPKIDAIRVELLEAFGLNWPEAPLEKLHDAIMSAGTQYTMVSDDGEEYGSLFGRFTWREPPSPKPGLIGRLLGSSLERR